MGPLGSVLNKKKTDREVFKKKMIKFELFGKKILFEGRQVLNDNFLTTKQLLDNYVGLY